MKTNLCILVFFTKQRDKERWLKGKCFLHADEIHPQILSVSL
jgi:hypothetical protein